MIITIYTKMVINVHEFCSLHYIKGEENKMMKLRILIGFNNILISAWIKENPCVERLRKKITVTELRRNKAAESLSGICVAAINANIELLVLEQEWNIQL